MRVSRENPISRGYVAYFNDLWPLNSRCFAFPQFNQVNVQGVLPQRWARLWGNGSGIQTEISFLTGRPLTIGQRSKREYDLEGSTLNPNVAPTNRCVRLRHANFPVAKYEKRQIQGKDDDG